MKTANEMRRIAIAENERREKEIGERRKKYIEEFIVPEVEKWANVGHFSVTVSAGECYKNALADEIEKFGYTVTILPSNCLRIEWK